MNELFFREKLLKWSALNPKNHPWKGERDPYKVWLSEIILQQTRVVQGTAYYLRFIETYPTVFDLAKAPEDEVMKLWEGLGYYSRARNLHFSAKYIVNELSGIFPKEHQDILKLKGVGTYTAAAIASFAYDLPKAVVDGNVIRVLARYFAIATPFDTGAGKKEFQAAAQKCLDKEKAAIYNQAIMDFGASVCSPKKPDCTNCPMQLHCAALKTNTVTTLPVKSKKIKIKTRYFLFFIVENKNKVLIEKRTDRDIWQDLYQFPLIETNEKTFKTGEKNIKKAGKALLEDALLEVKSTSNTYTQLLSHQKIFAKFITIKSTPFPSVKYIAIDKEKISNFAFPKVINLFLQDK